MLLGDDALLVLAASCPWIDGSGRAFPTPRAINHSNEAGTEHLISLHEQLIDTSTFLDEHSSTELEAALQYLNILFHLTIVIILNRDFFRGCIGLSQFQESKEAADISPMATLSGSSFPYSVFDKQYYITLVNLVLAPLFSQTPTLPIPDLAATDLSSFVHPEAKLYEYPHMLTAQGRQNYLTALRACSEPLNEFFKDAKYEVMGDIVPLVTPQLRRLITPDHSQSQEAGTSEAQCPPPNYGAAGMVVKAKVAVEILWTATVTKDWGEILKEGMQMKTRVAIFFDFENGQLTEQRDYNCVFPPSFPQQLPEPSGEDRALEG